MAALLLATAGCGIGESRLRVDTLVLADTTVVRISGEPGSSQALSLEEEWRTGGVDESGFPRFGRIGSFALLPDGGFVLYDAAQPAIRLFDGAGGFLRILGGPGTGPGEYLDDVGLAVTRNGTILQLDPQQARLNRYERSGGILEPWPAPGAFWAGDALVADTAGRVLYRSVIGVPSEDGTLPIGYRVIDSTGAVIDTIMRPAMPRPSTVHHPQRFSFVGPFGYRIGAEGGSYAVTLERPEGILRIERVVEPVAWRQGEREQIEAMFNFGRSGEPIRSLPEHRNLIDRIRQWDDGTIWVTTPIPSEPIPEAEVVGSSAVPDFPAITWRGRSAQDIYREDGTYLGRIVLSAGAELVAARGNRLWTVESDGDGEQSLVRYRIRGGSFPD